MANGAVRQIKRTPLRLHVAAAGDAAQFQRHGILLSALHAAGGKIGTFLSKGIPVAFPFPSRTDDAQGLRHGMGGRQTGFPACGGRRHPHLLGIRQRAFIHIVKQTGSSISPIVVSRQKPERSQQNQGGGCHNAASHGRPPFP